MTTDEKKLKLKEYLNKTSHLQRLYDMRDNILKAKEDNPAYYTAIMDEQLKEIQKEIETLIPEIKAVRNNILAEIKSINTGSSKDELYKDILEMRYILGYKWDDIVTSIHYCYDYVFRLHREALKFVFN